jgi:hypothetical protein
MRIIHSIVGCLVMSTLAGIVGCASTPGARPDDMSAVEHRQRAAEEEREADEHAANFDPNAAPEPGYVGGSKFWDVILYNPTRVHISDAATHKKHAEDHLAAAVTLEKFEQAECQSFPAETRKACPLLGTVESVEDVDGGVTLKLSSSIDTQASLAHVRCHLAFAAKEGRQGMDECPLYLPGVKASAEGNSHVLELKTDAEAGVSELRKRAREHVAP